MRYGFYFPTHGPTATREGILALVREGERLGLHSAMVADHIVLPVESRSTYPYTLDGKHLSAGDAPPGMATAGTRSAPPPPRRCRRGRCARISTH
jgi:alkanesulfonate monooxygenase SsuD/methylene tetrahydromethanopterin reductase-like flavin-dependent oxidoreductase (luciferase family)